MRKKDYLSDFLYDRYSLNIEQLHHQYQYQPVAEYHNNKLQKLLQLFNLKSEEKNVQTIFKHADNTKFFHLGYNEKHKKEQRIPKNYACQHFSIFGNKIETELLNTYLAKQNIFKNRSLIYIEKSKQQRIIDDLISFAKKHGYEQNICHINLLTNKPKLSYIHGYDIFEHHNEILADIFYSLHINKKQHQYDILNVFFRNLLNLLNIHNHRYNFHDILKFLNVEDFYKLLISSPESEETENLKQLYYLISQSTCLSYPNKENISNYNLYIKPLKNYIEKFLSEPLIFGDNHLPKFSIFDILKENKKIILISLPEQTNNSDDNFFEQIFSYLLTSLPSIFMNEAKENYKDLNLSIFLNNFCSNNYFSPSYLSQARALGINFSFTFNEPEMFLNLDKEFLDTIILNTGTRIFGQLPYQNSTLFLDYFQQIFQKEYTKEALLYLETQEFLVSSTYNTLNLEQKLINKNKYQRIKTIPIF